VIHLDTSFLVDLLREKRRAGDGPATRTLGDLADVELRVSVHVMCELHAGVELSSRGPEERKAVETLAAGVEVVYPHAGFAPLYGRLLARLQAEGRRISTMDLLIGTAALLDSAPLVTRNPKHFERIPDLEVVIY
jgi:predicted nucleic acid-binding protein